MMDVRELKVAEIHDDEDFNCRGIVAPIDVVSLAKDIEARGLQNPIQVQEYSPEDQKRTGYRWKLIAGFRRHMAHRVLKRETISCSVLTGLTDVQARLLNFGENLNRQDLNILQEAKAIRNLLLAGMPQEEIAKQLNQSRGWVQVRFYVLTLPPEIQKEAAAGMLSQQQIRDLYTIKRPEDQYAAVREIKERKARGEKTVKVEKKKKIPVNMKMPRDRAAIFEMMDHIQGAIGNNFGTRCLAWSSGEISSLELFNDIKEIAEEEGKHYEIPEKALSVMQ
jgi:ParB/RepB/Spo0J family partition protein